MREWTVGICGFRRLGRSTACVVMVCLFALGLSSAAVAEGASDKKSANLHGHASLDEIGRKLANPVSDVWALFTEFDLGFNSGEGRLNGQTPGQNYVYFQTIFQPIMPIKLTDSWKLITRPTLPVIWTSPDPTKNFSRQIALGDFFVPLMLSPDAPLHLWGGDVVGGLGPTFLFPTSTSDGFGNQKYEVGAASVVVWKNEKVTFGVFPQWFWGVGDRGAPRPDSSHGELLYFFYYNLPNAWQIGFNPTITIDAKAPAKNKWNVPLGITIAKTTKIGGHPVKFQVGIEYSVVSQDFYGRVGQIKLNIIPVIPDLIKKPLF